MFSWVDALKYLLLCADSLNSLYGEVFSLVVIVVFPHRMVTEADERKRSQMMLYTLCEVRC